MMAKNGNKNLAFLRSLANQLFENDKVAFDIEYQDRGDGQRERGYYLMHSYKDEEYQPSPPRGRDRPSYAWQKYVEGEHIGVSFHEAISQLCSMARMELDDTERQLESRRRDWQVARESIARLQVQHDESKLPSRWVICDRHRPYWGGNTRSILYGDDGTPYDMTFEEKGVPPNKVYTSLVEAQADCEKMNEGEDPDYGYVVRRWFPGPVVDDGQRSGLEPMLSEEARRDQNPT